MTAKNKCATRMEVCLERLGIPLEVVWIPKANNAKHGEVASGKLFIYDTDTDEMWLTFQHEVYEFKLKEVTNVYRELANCLIECFERLAYERKEKFIETLPRIAEIVSEERAQKLSPRYR